MIAYSIALANCTQSLQGVCKPSYTKGEFLKKKGGLTLTETQTSFHEMNKKRNVWWSFYTCYTSTLNIIAIKERKDVSIHNSFKGDWEHPLSSPRIVIKNLVYILIGLKGEDNTFTLILTNDLDMGLSHAVQYCVNNQSSHLVKLWLKDIQFPYM